MDAKEVKVETPLTTYMFAKASNIKIPLSGTFELSPVCNFNCKMCYVRKSSGEVAASLRPIMKLEQWISIAKQAREAGMLYLLLTGGEPFLWPDFWTLYEELSQMGFLISINTNGSLIDETVIRRLRQRPPTRVNITLYGAKDETYQALCGVRGVFRKIDRAIVGLQEAGITVKLNGSLTPDNIGDLEECVAYAQKHQLIYETNTYMFPPIRRDSEMIGRNDRFTAREAAYYNLKSYRLQYGDELYYRFLKKVESGFIPPPGLDESCIDARDGKVRCRAGKAAFWITWDGWLTPCGMMPEPKIELHGKGFKEAWKELVKVSGELVLSSVCNQCPNQKICHSCAAIAMTETGSTSGIPRYLCEKVIAMKELAHQELAKKV